MESLDEQVWDVLISGTGLQQSLLALALSRSGKRVLHVDKNDYYGGPDAGLSLQEAGDWVKAVNEGDYNFGILKGCANCDLGTFRSPFSQASVTKLLEDENASLGQTSKLSFSRAYTLALSPALIYADSSSILRTLISSQIYRQLEFLAVGTWWLYKPTRSSEQRNSLQRVPNGREDVFNDKNIDRRTKRALMRFLKLLVAYNSDDDIWVDHAAQPFTEFLTEQFELPAELHESLLALTLTPNSTKNVPVCVAIPRIAIHLRSIGTFGPGFGAVVAKWGGNAEIAQVACRAGAVGGGVYVLGRGISAICPHLDSIGGGLSKSLYEVELEGGEKVKARVVVGSTHDLPQDGIQTVDNHVTVVKSISIISSPLSSLFPAIAEGAPAPAVAVVVFPEGSIQAPNSALETHDGPLPPVNILVHNSDTGECPQGQCILYATTTLKSPAGALYISNAISALLTSLPSSQIADSDSKTYHHSNTPSSPAPTPQILYTLSYTQHGILPSSLSSSSTPDVLGGSYPSNPLFSFTLPSLELALRNSCVEEVEKVWDGVMHSLGVESSGRFCEFTERDGGGINEAGDEANDEDESYR